MSEAPGRSLEQELPALVGDQATAPAARDLRQLGRDLDRLARRDSDTQEIYIHEPSLRALLNKHSPPGFGKRYLRLMKEAPDGHLVRKTRPGKKDAIIPFETAAYAAGTAHPDGTPEALGLTPNSSLDDVRRAIQPHVPDLPDVMYRPELGERLQQAIARLDATAETDVSTELAPDYWEKMKICFGTRAGIWWEVGLVMFIWTFSILFASSGNVVGAILGALMVAGIFVLAWLLWGLIWCLISALF